MAVKMTINKSSMKKKVLLLLFNIWVVVEVILKLGNEVLRNVGVEEQIDDVSVFFR